MTLYVGTTFLEYFKQPYPVAANRWQIIIPISLFVCFFMLMFQPFGLSDSEKSGKWLILGGYGMVTFVVLVVDLFLLPLIFGKYFAEARWTIWKELVFLLFILLSIGIANLFYTSVFYQIRFTGYSFLLFVLFTSAIGIIPITALTLVKHSYLLRQNQQGASSLSQTLDAHKKTAIREQPTKTKSGILHFISESDHKGLSIDVENLLLIDAAGNYITIVYLEGNKTKKTLLRNTLLYAQQVTSPYSQIIKCHRSFVVNVEKINKVSGNSQGYMLRLEGYDEEVPVSRRHTSILKKAIAS